MRHFRVICKKCDSVIRQCRCPNPAKETQYEICDRCNNSSLECTQEEFNSAIIQALYSLEKTHEGKVQFLEWAKNEIDKKLQEEKSK